MRDPDRINRIIDVIRRYWLANPDLRFGQIVVNMTPDRFDRKDNEGFRFADPYHVEDDEWEAIFRAALKET